MPKVRAPNPTPAPRKDCASPRLPKAETARTADPAVTTALGSTPRQLFAQWASSPKLSIQRNKFSAYLHRIGVEMFSID